jgi:hypothetical protein
LAGMSWVTKLHAPMTAFPPMVTPGMVQKGSLFYHVKYLLPKTALGGNR